MALLFRHFPAVDGRLWHQLILPWQRRHLRQPLRSFSSHLDAERHALHSHAANHLSHIQRDAAQLDMARPENFTVYLRIPAWTDSKTRISVNGDGKSVV